MSLDNQRSKPNLESNFDLPKIDINRIGSLNESSREAIISDAGQFMELERMPRTKIQQMILQDLTSQRRE